MKTIEVKDCQLCFAVYVNTDLTEGRGYQYPKHICIASSTATRLATKADVQGSNGTVKPVQVFRFENVIYGPIYGPIGPTKEDQMEEQRLEIVRQQHNRYLLAIENAKKLGLSDDDIKTLQEIKHAQ